MKPDADEWENNSERRRIAQTLSQFPTKQVLESYFEVRDDRIDSGKSITQVVLAGWSKPGLRRPRQNLPDGSTGVLWSLASVQSRAPSSPRQG